MMLLKTCSYRDVKKSCLSNQVGLYFQLRNLTEKYAKCRYFHPNLKCLTHDHETTLKVDKVGLCTQMNIL